jgi:hypothetical protein
MIIPAANEGGPYGIFKRHGSSWRRICVVRNDVEQWDMTRSQAERWSEDLRNGKEPGHSQDADYCIFRLVWMLEED